MKKSFAVENVKCAGCASTIKSKLSEKFGAVEVDLSVTPRVISLELADVREEELRLELRKLGYPLSDDDLSKLQMIEAKAKSFVSCAIGKAVEVKAK